MPQYFLEVDFAPIVGLIIDLSEIGLRKLSLVSTESTIKHKFSDTNPIPGETGHEKPDKLFVEIKEQLLEYFKGSRRRFSVPLDLRSGTDFQRRVWHVLQQVPYGIVITYGEVAKRMGNQRAARAVGNACAANPVPVIIPCHRIVRSDGRLGGYTSNVNAKKSLLLLEGAISR